EPEIAGHAQNPCSGGANREPSISTADIRRDSATFSSRVNHCKLRRRKPQLLDLPGRLVMILAAFALGVWLAWTVGAFYRFRHRPAHRKASLIVNAAFLLGTTALLVWALLDSYRGVWPSVPTRIINFIAAPAQFWFIVALIAGSCCYAYRHEVREVIGSA